MELYIKNNLIDITYQSELILDILENFCRTKMSRINSSFASLSTRWTILNEVKNLAQTTYVHFIP